MAPIRDLIALGRELMCRGKSSLQTGRVSGAPMFRDGLMIAALATRPLRRRNLAALQVGVSLVRQNGQFQIHFPRPGTKTSQAIEINISAELTPAFQYYLTHVRPILLRKATIGDAGWLWIGRRGSPMSEAQISVRIGDLTRRHLGRRISPHLFRDCAATDIAVHDPDHVGIVKSVLGHASLATSEKYYNQASSFSASARYQCCIEKLRSDK